MSGSSDAPQDDPERSPEPAQYPQPTDSERQFYHYDQTLSDPRRMRRRSAEVRLWLGVLTWLIVLGVFVRAVIKGTEQVSQLIPFIVLAALVLLGVDQLKRLFGGMP